MNAFLRYTVLRILIFFGCLMLLWLLGLRAESERLLLVVGAALLSMVVSFFALKRFREDYSAQVATTLERRTSRRAHGGHGGSDEDAEDEEAARRAAPGDGDFR
ncbi:DUF4229 domain-containing protein [Nostocoides sp. Soil756]|uniref:DUF4229 domain-containing protein n=1 Tax=Nostocoides sp. Soil756 TaxID=1736399 RepID=UPI0009EC129D|nr:DUF4229 domain-containing protein [Tetrasphaera sp. Soil756]